MDRLEVIQSIKNTIKINIYQRNEAWQIRNFKCKTYIQSTVTVRPYCIQLYKTDYIYVYCETVFVENEQLFALMTID